MSRASFQTRYDETLAGLEPYLVRAPWNSDAFDPCPFGLDIPAPNIIDPTGPVWPGFLDRLCTLDALTFGPEGMPMPRWMFYEVSALPGGIFGFAVRAEALPPGQRSRLGLDDGAKGLVPVSMYIAIPARPPETWYGHNLASLKGILPERPLRGLGSLTKAFGLGCFRCSRQIGATQWDSAALHVHTRFGVLELLTAWTPAHAFPATLTYRLDVTPACVRAALGDPDAVRVERPEPTIRIRAGDEPAMRALQERIEAGERFVVTGPPGDDGVPVAVVA